MKKFFVLLVVVAMTCFSAVAFATDLTVGGSVEIRSRNFTGLTLDKSNNAFDAKDTQSRIRLDVNVMASDVKGKIELESDFDTTGSHDWGTSNGGPQAPGSTYNTGNTGFREAWINFNLPGIPVNVKVGHQLLQLGNGWFFRSGYFGSDAWVVSNQTGNNTTAFLDVKMNEGFIQRSDDADAYVLLDVLKLNETMTIGVNLTVLNDRSDILTFGSTTVPAMPSGKQTLFENLGLTLNGKFGPVALKAEIDVQDGKAKGNDRKLKGNQAVLQGNVAMDLLAINFTVARGSGDKVGGKDYDGYKNLLDIDQHYTLLYEYKINTAAGAKNTGFANTTAVSAGVSAVVLKSLTVGADLWFLMATEKTNVAMTGGPAGSTSDKIGTELDATVNWKLYDNLSWNWTLGYFKPGAAYKDGNGKGTDAATGVQGILAFRF